ncbi:hypothetical protein K6L44_08050 [Gluconacetobacter entanii]|uniref:Uncharacterized protein n=1 Tax=Gluconacetobacter entanii TaxID=108528 RepID=A0ABT3K1H4_9PROT|nr:hypothetical protein [Gluconacetobacter entanii]MBY4639940.1 hypothetical protein [Gluconacetobacter entanii]MCW4581619.1 hypothetical protein [Gluconacetobacter entanii]MCW4584960.1 hypothetical protein [Gluconacetobacter entanii]MCW4588374.1 hypothetical protein [Gluconacetobacter entanii]MCW4589254.1 hypothetical protein [Gluconacetobacter entanii]
MATEVVRDSSNRVIGYIDDMGDRVLAKGQNGIVIGNYDKILNRTLDASSNIVGNGNLLSALIYNQR